MPRRPDTHAFRLFALAAFVLFAAHAAQAAKQTFVAAGGDDANACDQAAPCRTFAGALLKTDTGGEIAVANSGEYGTLVVNKSVRVTAVGVYAGVTAYNDVGVKLNPPAGAVVALRGLTITGGSISQGITYYGPTVAREGEPTATLHVEDCTLSGFSTVGILFYGNGDLFVKDTTVRGTQGDGIQVYSPAGQKSRASIVNTRLEKNGRGLAAFGPGSVSVTARDTIAAGNRDLNFAAYGSSNVRMHLQGCVSTHSTIGMWVYDGARVSVEGCLFSNQEIAIYTNNLGEVRLSNTTIADNVVGIQNVIFNGQGAYGNVITFGNNRLSGNSQNVVGKSSVDALPY